MLGKWIKTLVTWLYKPTWPIGLTRVEDNLVLNWSITDRHISIWLVELHPFRMTVSRVFRSKATIIQSRFDPKQSEVIWNNKTLLSFFQLINMLCKQSDHHHATRGAFQEKHKPIHMLLRLPFQNQTYVALLRMAVLYFQIFTICFWVVRRRRVTIVIWDMAWSAVWGLHHSHFSTVRTKIVENVCTHI